MVWNSVTNIKGPKGDRGDKGPAGALTFATTPPASPVAGDKWVDTADPGVLVEYTWFVDADSAQWVELGSGGIVPDPASKANTWSQPQAFNAGVAVGDQSPVLKIKVVTVVAPAGPGGSSVAHGLDRSKIRMVSATVNGVLYNVGPDYATNPEIAYSAYTNDDTCNVYIGSAAASGIFGRKVYFTIFYAP